MVALRISCSEKREGAKGCMLVRNLVPGQATAKASRSWPSSDPQ